MCFFYFFYFLFIAMFFRFSFFHLIFFDTICQISSSIGLLSVPMPIHDLLLQNAADGNSYKLKYNRTWAEMRRKIKAESKEKDRFCSVWPFPVRETDRGEIRRGEGSLMKPARVSLPACLPTICCFSIWCSLCVILTTHTHGHLVQHTGANMHL